jgi:hypothetical protein
VSLFDRFRQRKPHGAGPGPSAKSLADLKEFMATRDGVEAFVEPPTAVYAMTLCLVAGDGEYRRQPVKDERQARSMCADHGVPIYDARIVGYPKRMREYERGIRQQQISLDDLPSLDLVAEPEPKPQPETEPKRQPGSEPPHHEE